MTNASIKQYADELSDILMKIEDAKVEASAILEAAKEAGINTKALRKVAKEMTMQSDKLQQKFEDEIQLSFFRDKVGIRQRKGLAA
jgi:F0F1-type ATP synthase membrane subunit b/b'